MCESEGIYICGWLGRALAEDKQVREIKIHRHSRRRNRDRVGGQLEHINEESKETKEKGIARPTNVAVKIQVAWAAYRFGNSEGLKIRAATNFATSIPSDFLGVKTRFN
jgi:hypothetical protein